MQCIKPTREENVKENELADKEVEDVVNAYVFYVCLQVI
jgi:hypothetical protein